MNNILYPVGSFQTGITGLTTPIQKPGTTPPHDFSPSLLSDVDSLSYGSRPEQCLPISGIYRRTLVGAPGSQRKISISSLKELALAGGGFPLSGNTATSGILCIKLMGLGKPCESQFSGGGQRIHNNMENRFDKGVGTYNPPQEKSIIDEGVNIWIDELTPCLREGKTGKIVDTAYKLINCSSEINKIAREQKWEFDWMAEWNKREKNSEFYKLTVKGTTQTQGIIHILVEEGFVEAKTMESAPHNREEIVGKEKRKYKGVGGHLVAIAVKRSIEKGYGGYVGFTSITKRVEQYKKMLCAKVLCRAPSGAVRMAIEEKSARELYNQYFGDAE